MNKKLLFIALVACLFASCYHTKKQQTEELIAGKEYKYWYVDTFATNGVGDTVPFRRIYFFDREGNYFAFVKMDTIKYSEMKHSLLEYKKRWRLESDSVIDFFDSKSYEILELTPQTKVYISRWRSNNEP